jgi:uncharacterized protein YukE
MADIYLDPKVIEDAEQSLTQAHHAMGDSVDQTNAGLSEASAHLDGQTNDAWDQFRVEANNNATAMNDDFNVGIQKLQEIRSLLIEADHRGASRFQ